jgi:GNAT superfamily N-acetyltransferase
LRKIEKFVNVTPQNRGFLVKYFYFLLLIAQWSVLGALETSSFTTRQARVEDVDILFELIFEFTEFEGQKLASLPARKANLRRYLSEQIPYCHVELAENENGIVGYAFYSYIYSGQEGAPFLYVDELYVTPSERGIGIGSGLLKQLALYAKEMDCCTMEWVAFDWNDRAIAFYENRDAVIRDDLLFFQMDKEAYYQLAQ